MHLELGLLGLEHTVEFGGEHDVALDLELAGHESLLAVNLAVGEVDEGVIGEVDGDISLSLGLALVSFSVLLEVNGPDELLAFGVLDVHFEAAVGLLLDVLLLLVITQSS